MTLFIFFTFKIEYLVLTNVRLNNVKESHQMFASTRVHLFSSILKDFFFLLSPFFSGSHLTETASKSQAKSFKIY